MSEATDDIANDDPKAIEFNQLIANQDVIAAWLTNITQATYEKSDVIGHSLGLCCKNFGIRYRQETINKIFAFELLPRFVPLIFCNTTQAIAILGARGIEQKSILDNKREMTAEPETPELRTVFFENFPISYANTKGKRDTRK